jgi:hypothetical protein
VWRHRTSAIPVRFRAVSSSPVKMCFVRASGACFRVPLLSEPVQRRTRTWAGWLDSRGGGDGTVTEEIERREDATPGSGGSNSPGSRPKQDDDYRLAPAAGTSKRSDIARWPLSHSIMNWRGRPRPSMNSSAGSSLRRCRPRVRAVRKPTGGVPAGTERSHRRFGCRRDGKRGRPHREQRDRDDMSMICEPWARVVSE